MHSAHNVEKSVVVERFIRTLNKQNLQINDFNTKKNVYIYKLEQCILQDNQSEPCWYKVNHIYWLRIIK